MAKLYVTDPSEVLSREHMSKGKDFDPPARTIPQAFQHRVNLYKDKVALRVQRSKESAEVTEWTTSEYLESVKRVARALIAVGFKKHDAVSILGSNSPEWFFAAYGAIFAGGMSAGIYVTNGANACKFVIDHSKSVVVFLDQAQLPKMQQVADTLSSVKYFVLMYGGTKPEGHDNVLTWEEFLRLGEDNGFEKEMNTRVEGMVPGNA
eukprot:Sspe_Gene.89130::Locus_60980_Transcript_1_1_Confidence_1.000_Length_668::g.89130::m.89130/K15013/ACSBG; long-chain-fatty-acid--CoA ligase ACSBG